MELLEVELLEVEERVAEPRQPLKGQQQPQVGVEVEEEETRWGRMTTRRTT